MGYYYFSSDGGIENKQNDERVFDIVGRNEATGWAQCIYMQMSGDTTRRK